MKLFYSATSPFVRKCLVTAHELGLRERLELVPAAAHPVNRGVICGKGAAGIMHQQSPAKLRKPLLRVGERGEYARQLEVRRRRLKHVVHHASEHK